MIANLCLFVIGNIKLRNVVRKIKNIILSNFINTDVNEYSQNLTISEIEISKLHYK
ncbi:Hypothetical protein FNO222_1433 [Francisella orientalis]|uniref:Uncharacterized protein n=1 Tax=Francisella orientalis TaxID=299583 RepID=A0ABM5U740_9GAMM|nr:hypothetical protein OOM_0879 [Francisella orientalis str. Toba 04]AHB98727.1 hypothetical protein M973_07890 [Francisella orientalis LADL 07-285A]AKN85982.1 hypothetical protein FNO12_1420 [Francisella orientalis FNO12]AKN87520.1 Hypothetical protein FNO24_1422 [Francisella orientalis FNO24]AKN89058.1 Hypothetical protein FNO190_1420 [Francisella orientalis]